MNHWMGDDKSLVLYLCDLHQKCDGRPPKPNGDHSLVSQKGSNYFLRIDPNTITGFSGLCNGHQQDQSSWEAHHSWGYGISQPFNIHVTNSVSYAALHLLDIMYSAMALCRWFGALFPIQAFFHGHKQQKPCSSVMIAAHNLCFLQSCNPPVGLISILPSLCIASIPISKSYPTGLSHTTSASTLAQSPPLLWSK